MNAGCPVCRCQEHRPILSVRGFAIVQCAGCQLQYVWPMPTPAELAGYYQDPSYFAGDVNEGYADYEALAKVLRPLAVRRLQAIGNALGQPGRILDFGCAAGYFLEQAQQIGWQIAGVELAQGMAEHAAARLGIPITADLDPALHPAGSFDAITLWEVIEHLPEPVATLQCLAALLRPGGLIALSTPNTGHWQAVTAPETWTSYRPPAHLLYFTAETLRDTLQRAGLSAITIGRSGPLPPLPGWLAGPPSPCSAGWRAARRQRGDSPS